MRYITLKPNQRITQKLSGEQCESIQNMISRALNRTKRKIWKETTHPSMLKQEDLDY